MAQEKYLGENGLKKLVGLVKEDLGTKANIDGSYDTMQVGSAKQIVSPTGITDTTPYVFRTTCGETSISGGDEQLASLKGIRGNTIAWNQLVKNGNFEDNTGWVLNHVTLSVSNNTATIVSQGSSAYGIYTLASPNAILGHKYLVMYTAWASAPISCGYGYGELYKVLAFNVGTSPKLCAEIFTPNSTDKVFYIYTWQNTETLYVRDAMLFDLTQMFGPGNEPTSVLEFTRMFPKGYYPFNPGEIRNAKTTGLKTVGYNAFDGELRKGYYANGNYISLNNSVCNVNPIKVVPCQTYTLERSITFIPSVDEMAIAEYDENMNFIKKTGVNTATNKLTLTSNTHYCNWWIYKSGIGATVPTQEQAQICFHLTWSGSRTGYVPHEEHVLDIDTSRYFPDGMNGFDGVYDELTPKTANKRIGSYTFTGNETFVDYIGNGWSLSMVLDGIKKPSSSNDKAIAKWAYGITLPVNSLSSSPEYTIGVNELGRLYIVTKKTSSELASDLIGKTIYFALAEPVVTEIPQVRDNHWEIKVDDYGTEEWLFAEGDEIPVPVGHETLYMDNLVDKLRNLPDPNDYKALESELQTWVKLPPLPTDTTKVYVPKFVNGTIKWVEE